MTVPAPCGAPTSTGVVTTLCPIRAPPSPGVPSTAIVTKPAIGGDEDEEHYENGPTCVPCKATKTIDEHDGEKPCIAKNGVKHRILTSTAPSITGIIDATPVPDLTFVTPGPMKDLPTAPMLNAPVPSGP